MEMGPWKGLFLPDVSVTGSSNSYSSSAARRKKKKHKKMKRSEKKEGNKGSCEGKYKIIINNK